MPGKPELNSAIVAIPFEVAFRPVISDARVGTQRGCVEIGVLDAHVGNPGHGRRLDRTAECVHDRNPRRPRRSVRRSVRFPGPLATGRVCPVSLECPLMSRAIFPLNPLAIIKASSYVKNEPGIVSHPTVIRNTVVVRVWEECRIHSRINITPRWANRSAISATFSRYSPDGPSNACLRPSAHPRT